MTVSEFAESRNIKVGTVRQYLYRNHIPYDRNKGLTEDQIKALEAVYPLPAPTVIVNGLPLEDERKLREELEQAQSSLLKARETIIELYEDKHKLTMENASLKLLEDKSAEQLRRISELQDEIEKLKNRTLLQRIFNKN